MDGLYDKLGEYENLDELNYLASKLDEMDQGDYARFQVGMEMGDHCGSLQEIINLTENLDCYEIYPDIEDYLTLLKQQGQDWRKTNTLALGGISGKGVQRSPLALTQYLKAAPHISRIVLCLDNEAPGQAAAAALRKLLAGYEVIDKPPSRGKDYNDLLQYRHCVQRGEAR